MIKAEFTGMLPGAIVKFEELLEAVANLEAKVIKGYDASMGKGSFYYWGVACRIGCSDMEALQDECKRLGFLWLSDDGDIAYTGSLSIDDFQTYRVNGNLEWMPEKEDM